MNSYSASPRSKKVHGRRLTPAQVRQVRRDLAQGLLTQTEIAAKRGVSQGTVSRISRSREPRLGGEPLASLEDMDYIERELDALRERVRQHIPDAPDEVLDLAVAELLATHMPDRSRS